jgi:uncharacterized Tic20 family protein
MANFDSNQSTPDERVMAALAHISVLLPLMGTIAPIVIWVTQKDKSRFVAFQALQAMVFQLIMVAAWFVGMGCYMASFITTFVALPLASASGNDQSVPPVFALAFLIPFLVFGFIFLCGFLFIVYGVIGAVMVFQGKPFRYILIGKRIESFMDRKESSLISG